jgi:hypothetical protein
MVILTFVTLGFYALYWYCAFQAELKEKTGEGFGWVGHLLATIFTFGLYGIVWNYNAGKRLHKLGTDDWSLVYLLLILVGVGGIINMILMQHQANNVK